MKKTCLILVVLITVFTLVFAGCKDKVDYSQYSFTDVTWTRQGEHDEETIRFGSDGSFDYSCACGNPVNDADVCEGYTYDDETKTITLTCIEEIEGMITTITVEKYDDTSLHLKFGDETRVFTKAE